MFARIALIAAFIPMTGHGQNVELSELPEPVAKFCMVTFDGKIAARGQRFNSTDVIDARLPERRIVAFATFGATSFLWFEHGGLLSHQHLVGFSSDRPEQILESYVLFGSIDRPIEEVVAGRSKLERYDVRE